MRSSNARGPTVRGRLFDATVEEGALRTSGRGVEAGGDAGGVAGAAASFAGGAAGLACGVGVAAGGADATVGPADGVAAGDASVGEGDGIGAGGIGGDAASWDGRLSLSKNELTDEYAASARWRAELTSATYPETCRPTPTKPRKVLKSIKAMSAMTKVRMGCRSG
jgi:hypothetical protein